MVLCGQYSCIYYRDCTIVSGGIATHAELWFYLSCQSNLINYEYDDATHDWDLKGYLWLDILPDDYVNPKHIMRLA